MSRKDMNIYKHRNERLRYRKTNFKKIRKQYYSAYVNTYNVKKPARRLNDTKSCIETLAFTVCAANWLKDTEKRVKPSTFANYRFLLEKHIIPFFRKYAMQELCGSDIEQFVSEKLVSGRLKRSCGLSKKYLKDIVAVIKQVAAYAESRYGIPDKIRDTTTPKPEKTEIQTLTGEDKRTLTSFLNNRNKSMDLGILISLFTGMRIGEVCGLKWSDIDMKEKIICVRRTVQRICTGKGGTMLYVGTPKTKSSYRIIPIPEILINPLSKMPYLPDTAVISGTEKYIEPQRLRKHFKAVLEECNIKNIKYHSLRHTFASECVRLGFDIKALSEILGHSSTSTTLEVYAHTSLDTKRMYMERISA